MNIDDILQMQAEHTVTFEQACHDPSMLENPTSNPYWDEVKQLPGERDILHGQWNPKFHYFTREGNLERPREALVVKYAWAIPDPATLRFIAEYAQGRLVEMGAGTGYWAYQLSQLGIDCLCYDLHPPNLSNENHWHCPHDENMRPTGQLGVSYYMVRKGTPEHLSGHADRTLFLCWPPYEDSMAAECLKHYTGKRLIYIGEGKGGCTGNDTFHLMLSEHWEEVADHLPVQWETLHDYVIVYER